MPLHPSFIGGVISAGFLVAISWVYIWMFRIPPLLPHQVVTIRRSVTNIRTILVPIIGLTPSERAVELAARLGEPQKARLILTHVIEVPLLLPVDAPLPDREQEGVEVLKTAALIAKQHGLEVVTRLIRSRQAWDGILTVASEVHANLIVLGVGHLRPRGGEDIGLTLREVLRRASCEVILDKPAMEEDWTLAHHIGAAAR